MKEYLKTNSISKLLENPYFCNKSLKEWCLSIEEVYGKVFPNTLLQILKRKIELYDISDSVNGFLIGDKHFWLDKNTRIGLMHLANCSKDTIQLALDDQILTIPVNVAKEFLSKLEVYAGQCYLQTQKHLKNLNQLHTIEDIINYDYTKGYPEKINFNLWEQ